MKEPEARKVRRILPCRRQEFMLPVGEAQAAPADHLEQAAQAEVIQAAQTRPRPAEAAPVASLGGGQATTSSHPVKDAAYTTSTTGGPGKAGTPSTTTGDQNLTGDAKATDPDRLKSVAHAITSGAGTAVAGADMAGTGRTTPSATANNGGKALGVGGALGLAKIGAGEMNTAPAMLTFPTTAAGTASPIPGDTPVGVTTPTASPLLTDGPPSPMPPPGPTAPAEPQPPSRLSTAFQQTLSDSGELAATMGLGGISVPAVGLAPWAFGLSGVAEVVPPVAGLVAGGLVLGFLGDVAAHYFMPDPTSSGPDTTGYDNNGYEQP